MFCTLLMVAGLQAPIDQHPPTVCPWVAMWQQVSAPSRCGPSAAPAQQLVIPVPHEDAVYALSELADCLTGGGDFPRAGRALASLIRHSVPGCWHEGVVEYAPHNRTVRVRRCPSTLQEIDTFLSVLREEPSVEVELLLVRVPTESLHQLLAKLPSQPKCRFLTTKEVDTFQTNMKRIENCKVVCRPRVQTGNQQVASFQLTGQLSIWDSVEIRWDGQGESGVRIVPTFRQSPVEYQIEVEPVVSKDRKYVRLEVHPQLRFEAHPVMVPIEVALPDPQGGKQRVRHWLPQAHPDRFQDVRMTVTAALPDQGSMLMRLAELPAGRIGNRGERSVEVPPSDQPTDTVFLLVTPRVLD